MGGRSLQGALGPAWAVREGFMEEEVNELRPEGQEGVIQVESDQGFSERSPGG